MHALRGTTAIATGGASGLGLAITEALAARDTRVAVFDIQAGQLDTEVAPLRGRGRRGLRDPSNTQADIREAVADAGFPGLTSHLFGRKVSNPGAAETLASPTFRTAPSAT